MGNSEPLFTAAFFSLLYERLLFFFGERDMWLVAIDL